MKAFAIPTECFPLAWPTGVPRTQHPRVAPFGRGYNRTTHLSDQIDAVYREMKLIKRHHPDRGGDPSVAAAINVALAQAEAELGGGS